MELLGLLIIMLISVAAVIVVFVGLATSALATYILTVAALQARCWEATPGGAVSRAPWWRIQQHLWRYAWARGSTRVAARTARTLSFVGIASAMGYLVGYIVMLPFYAMPLLIGRPAAPETPLIPAIGAILSLFSLAKCLRYLTGRAPKRQPLRGPEFRLTDRTVPLRDRVEFNRKIYLYTHLQWAARRASALGPALALAGLLQATTSMQPTAPTATFTWTTQNILGVLGFICYLALAIVVADRLRVVIAVVFSPVHAAIAVYQFLGITENEDTESTIGWARDPLGVKRTALDHAALALTRAGQRLDRASTEHPLASVILGCAHYIRSFLTGNGALTACYPTELPEVLTAVLAVLAGPANPYRAATLGVLVGAFDNNGQPKIGLRSKQAGRWALLLGRAGDSLDRYSRIATAAWAIFSFAVVVFLIVSGRLDLAAFQLQK